MATKKIRSQKAAELAQGQDMTTVGLSLPVAQLRLLKAAAHAQARKNGGRASVSALISELVAKHESELRRRAGKYLSLFE